MIINHIEKKGLYNTAILAVTIFVSMVFFIWQSHLGFDLADEGFLWYGAQRVILGEVPIRDFPSYDPGRYYWAAILMSVYGDNGIVALRVAAAIFQAIGLYISLFLISFHVKKISILYLLISGILLTLWVFPYYRSFDISLCMAAIAALTFLIINPTKERYFLTGLFISLIAFFGRNYALYSALACLGVIFWISLNQLSSIAFKNGFIYWCAGLLVGFLPIIIMLLFIEGFAISFWESVAVHSQSKATNITLPIPWPWELNFLSIGIVRAVRGVMIGCLFIALLAIPILIISLMAFKKLANLSLSPVFVAAIFAALPYAHYAYSRADEVHLALSLMPIIIIVLIVAATQKVSIKWCVMLWALMISLFVVLPFHPGWQTYRDGNFIDLDISGDIIKIHPSVKKQIDTFSAINARYGKKGADFIVLPFWPSAYALMGKKSPIYDMCALHPRNQSFEQAEIARIKSANISFIHIWNEPVDGREDLLYRNIRPLVYNYIRNNFIAVVDPANPDSEIYISSY